MYHEIDSFTGTQSELVFEFYYVLFSSLSVCTEVYPAVADVY